MILLVSVSRSGGLSGNRTHDQGNSPEAIMNFFRRPVTTSGRAGGIRTRDRGIMSSMLKPSRATAPEWTTMNCTICQEPLTGQQRLYCSKTCKYQSQNIRNQNYAKQQERAKTRKLRAIRDKGGQCGKCGYAKNYAALVFHHVDGKDFGLDSRRFSNTSQVKLDVELAKTELLCHNCHMEEHHPSCDLSEIFPPLPGVMTVLRWFPRL